MWRVTSKTILERIARALCSSDGLPENTSFEGAPMWRSYLLKAESVLRAIRVEPTADMASAANAVTETTISPSEVWVAMIDAALAERP